METSEEVTKVIKKQKRELMYRLIAYKYKDCKNMKFVW